MAHFEDHFEKVAKLARMLTKLEKQDKVRNPQMRGFRLGLIPAL